MIVILLLNVALPASILATLFVSVKKPNVVLAKSYCNLLYPATLPNANPLVASLLIVEQNVAAPVDAIDNLLEPNIFKFIVPPTP